MERPLQPGGTIGILGGGQLGRMSAIAARRLGYKVRTFDPSASACAAGIADEHVTADWSDTAALTRFAQGCGPVRTVAQASVLPHHPRVREHPACDR